MFKHIMSLSSKAFGKTQMLELAVIKAWDLANRIFFVG